MVVIGFSCRRIGECLRANMSELKRRGTGVDIEARGVFILWGRRCHDVVLYLLCKLFSDFNASDIQT